MRLINQLFGDKSYRHFGYAEDPFLCGVVCGPTLQQALENMPALNHIVVAAKERVVHGLSWGTIKMLFSLPHIREVSIIGLLFCPSKLPDDNYSCDSLNPLTSFHYEVRSIRFTSLGTRQDYPFPSEEELLHLALDRLHLSLEKLVLSSEPAPMLSMSRWRWPHLRELRLRGEWQSEPPVSYFSLLAAMPNLRVLILELALVAGELRRTAPIWPTGAETGLSFPWPDLSRLSVSHPHPKDELYSRLPPSVHALSLCCYPHKSEKAWLELHAASTVQEYEYPLLSSMDLHGLLEDCRLPHLSRLDIEYSVDSRELDLLRSIAVLFPRLNWLQLHRYRSHEAEQVRLPIALIYLNLLMLRHHRKTMILVGWYVVADTWHVVQRPE